ncbi:MAG: hypothetical protein Q4D05_01665, partial [Acinetobacter sp.]|nr:hypothetical protein [Acinetobacter sp.]
DLQLYYQICCKGREDLNLAVTQAQGFEMCMLRLLAFRPLAINEVVMPTVAHNTVEQQPTSSVAPNNAQPTAISPTVAAAQQNVEHVATTNGVVTSEPVETPNETLDISAYTQFDIAQGALLDLLQGQYKIVAQPVASQLSGVVLLDLAQSQQGLIDVLQNQAPAWTAIEELQQTQQQQMQARQVDPLHNLSPQQILQVPEQELTGQWTLEKWAYWIEQSTLSPVEQNLLRQGVIQGEVLGEAVLMIPQKQHTMFSSFEQQILKVLRSFNPNIKLQYVEQMTEMTPQQWQHQRQAMAHERAVQWVHQEEGMAELIHTFSGQIVNVELSELKS